MFRLTEPVKNVRFDPNLVPNLNFFQVCINSPVFAVQYEDQGLGTHDWALDVDDSETHNLP